MYTYDNIICNISEISDEKYIFFVMKLNHDLPGTVEIPCRDSRKPWRHRDPVADSLDPSARPQNDDFLSAYIVFL